MIFSLIGKKISYFNKKKIFKEDGSLHEWTGF